MRIRGVQNVSQPCKSCGHSVQVQATVVVARQTDSYHIFHLRDHTGKHLGCFHVDYAPEVPGGKKDIDVFFTGNFTLSDGGDTITLQKPEE